MFDPGALHYWSETRPRGEWPVVEIEPACSPRERRRVPVAMIDGDAVAPADAVRCDVCDAVAAVLA